jgi:hypothetical protein
MPIMFLIVYYGKIFHEKYSFVSSDIPIIAFIGLYGACNWVFDKKWIQINTSWNIYLEKPETKIFRYIIERKNYSGQFYSNGKAQLITNENQFDSILKINKK